MSKDKLMTYATSPSYTCHASWSGYRGINERFEGPIVKQTSITTLGVSWEA